MAVLTAGRLAGTGYVSILPVDQGIEHSAGASFAPNPIYFDAENIVKLAIEGGCNAVASTFGVLGAVARKYAHKIPFIVKLNHNELLTYPNKYDQVMFGNVQQAYDMGAAGVGATVYFGWPESPRQIVEVAQAFAARPRARHVHRPVVLRAQQRLQEGRRQLRNGRRPDRPGQPPRRDDRGRHHQAEAAPRTTAATTRRLKGFGKTHKLVYDEADHRQPDRPDPLPGRQLLHGPRRASSTPAARRARTTSPRPSAPRSSTSAPAAWD